MPGLKPMDDLTVKFQVNIKQGREIVKSCIGHNWSPAVAIFPFVNKGWKKNNNYKQQQETLSSWNESKRILGSMLPNVMEISRSSRMHLSLLSLLHQRSSTRVTNATSVLNSAWNAIYLGLNDKFLPGSLQLKLDHYLLQKGRLETERK